jgi:hypothetical protein
MISSELDWLKTKKTELLKELQKTKEAITIESARLDRVPTLINQAKDEYSPSLVRPSCAIKLPNPSLHWMKKTRST